MIKMKGKGGKKGEAGAKESGLLLNAACFRSLSRSHPGYKPDVHASKKRKRETQIEGEGSEGETRARKRESEKNTAVYYYLTGGMLDPVALPGPKQMGKEGRKGRAIITMVHTAVPHGTLISFE
ncbi:hypothetical protein TWF694_001645 [Orbilia ellipsospora]|uniref:Uncharacterized protein n=1 Tax=Orbilia ellipsospora TaxID=2528407 RepID=A0AAV9X372_9PEZI